MNSPRPEDDLVINLKKGIEKLKKRAPEIIAVLTAPELLGSKGAKKPAPQRKSILKGRHR